MIKGLEHICGNLHHAKAAPFRSVMEGKHRALSFLKFWLALSEHNLTLSFSVIQCKWNFNVHNNVQILICIILMDIASMRGKMTGYNGKAANWQTNNYH